MGSPGDLNTGPGTFAVAVRTDDAPPATYVTFAAMTSPAMTPEALVGLLAEPARLRVAAAIVLGARTPSEVIAASGLDQRAVGVSLRRLEAGGLVQSSRDGFRVREELFKELARASAAAREHEDHGYRDQQVESVVRTFVRDGRLVRLPAQASRRRTVLEHVAQSFEPGTRYSEREVDAVLRAWSAGGQADHVSLRRYLVDEGLLTRENGLYWRSGGWVDVLDTSD